MRRAALALAALAPVLLAGRAEDEPDVLRSAPRPGRLLLVSREDPTDPGILALLGPTSGERVELVLADARSEGGAALPGTPPGVVTLFAGERRAADERALEARLAAAGTIVLRGGSLLGWYEALSPRDHPTGAWRGILRGIRGGADVVGLGGGAAYLAGASLVARDELPKAPRNPRQKRPFAAAVGMGLGPPGIVEVEPRGDEHALRLLHELAETRASLGFRLEGEAALWIDYRRGRVEVLGPGRVVVLDTRGAREDRGLVREARLWLLHAGDAWELGHRRALPDPRAEGLPAPGAHQAVRSMDSLDQGLAAALEPLGGSELGRLVLEGPFGRLELGLDARSRRWRGEGGTSLSGLTLCWLAPGSPVRTCR